MNIVTLSDMDMNLFFHGEGLVDEDMRLVLVMRLEGLRRCISDGPAQRDGEAIFFLFRNATLQA